jgi:hypothetical protein
MSAPWQKISILAAACLLSTTGLAKKKQKVHEHGAAKLSIAVEGTSALIMLESPSDNVFGFEHAPSNDKEKEVITTAMKVLREKAGDLFVFPAELGCTPQAVEVKAGQEDAMKNAKAEKGGKGETHNDIDAEYKFECKSPLAGTVLKLGILTLFPKIATLAVQVSGVNQSGKVASSHDDTVKL